MKISKESLGRGLLLLGITVIILFDVYLALWGSDYQNPDVAEATVEETQEATTTQEPEPETQEDEVPSETIPLVNKQGSPEAALTQKEKSTLSSTWNSDIREWPCGNPYLKNEEEPISVKEIAKYKEYYDAFAESFSRYEGEAVYYYFHTHDKKIYYKMLTSLDLGDDTINPIEIEIDEAVVKQLFDSTHVRSIHIRPERIEIKIIDCDWDTIYYYYDATRDLWGEGGLGYNTANFADHWWYDGGVRNFE